MVFVSIKLKPWGSDLLTANRWNYKLFQSTREYQQESLQSPNVILLMSIIFPQIVGFGYTPEQSLLYGAPAGAVQVIMLMINAVAMDYFQQRLLVATGGIYLGIIGVILMVALPSSNNTGRLVGYSLTNSVTTAFVCMLAIISSNIAGYTKKTTVAAMFLMGYCAGNIIGSFATKLPPGSICTS